MLLEHDADIDIRDNFGKAPLHWAAMTRVNGNAEDMLKTMQLLLDHGADPNVRDDDGCTPLHDSSWWKKKVYGPFSGTVEGSHVLLDRGANIDAENNEGKTPLQLALEAGYHEMVEFLSGRGAKRLGMVIPSVP
jgi:ankyrin repeat protein